jgi:hypothetical protein
MNRSLVGLAILSIADPALASGIRASDIAPDFMDRMLSGKMSVSDCSTRPAPIVQAGTRKMGAGRIGATKDVCPSANWSIERHDDKLKRFIASTAEGTKVR